MILDQLTLHNFGLYRGRQTADLSTDPGRPIILFGGLNGAGKTTLLDALQLCLYGQLAACSTRRDLAYDDFLAQCISRGVAPQEAAVEVTFRHRSEGVEDCYRIHRSWSLKGKSCRERLEVIRNDRFDQVATEYWAEQVEEFLPARIAHLFLFDGEQVEGYAHPQRSAALIATGVQNLLGLDLIERLAADLKLLERKKTSEGRKSTDAQQLKRLEADLEATRAKLETAFQQTAHLRTVLDQRERQLIKANERFKREGGELFLQQASIEANHQAAREHLQRIERELRDVAAGAAPMLLVENLLIAVHQQDRAETNAEQAQALAQALSDRDSWVIDLVAEFGLPRPAVTKFQAVLAADRAKRSDGGIVPYLRMTTSEREVLGQVLAAELPAAKQQVISMLKEDAEARERLREAATRLAAVPEADALHEVLSERKALTDAVARLQQELSAALVEEDRLRRECERAQEALDRAYSAYQEERLERNDIGRILTHSGKVRGTLAKLQSVVVQRHVARIEALVLDSFRHLLRKGTLVANLRIDPGSFALTIIGPDGLVVPAERLSAGERQLLSVAVLWGLARASGRPLPTVIDTPMGRLDSVHRNLLVRRYFPYASHQVVLLSTDEEIVGPYEKALEPYIGRRYELVYDEASRSTYIQPGYLRGGLQHAS
ncbi:DNA sulfur modification protein DndD [Azospirillum sp. sgz302134]